MRTSQAGIDLLKSFEGCRLVAYQDGGGVWTVGFGDTGPDVVEGTVWTQQEADDRLAERLEGFEDCVNAAVEVDLTQNQFDACVDLAYNIGCSAFRNSTLVRLLNGGNTDAAAGQFIRWSHDNGVLVPGLERRRLAEKALFLETV